MATFGKIEEFRDYDDWGQYIERLENYFEANEIDEADKNRESV